MTALSKEAGHASEFDDLLDLAARRTPGRIQARASSLQVGSYAVQGFPKEADAHYLAQAGAVLPRLIQQLITARAVVQEQAQEVVSLREEILNLSSLLVAAYEERDQARNALKGVQNRLHTLRRKQSISAREERRVVEVPARWVAPDGNAYELVFLGEAFPEIPALPEQTDLTLVPA